MSRTILISRYKRTLSSLHQTFIASIPVVMNLWYAKQLNHRIVFFAATYLFFCATKLAKLVTNLIHPRTPLTSRMAHSFSRSRSSKLRNVRPLAVPICCCRGLCPVGTGTSPICTARTPPRRPASGGCPRFRGLFCAIPPLCSPSLSSPLKKSSLRSSRDLARVARFFLVCETKTG
jgi:hypothetical protein